MKSICFTVLLLFQFTVSIAQDNKDIANVYLMKAQKSAAQNEFNNTEKYLARALKYLDGKPTEELTIFASEYYFGQKNFVKAKEHLKAFFDINKDKSSPKYKEMLFLYTEVLDKLDFDEKEKEVVKDAIKTKTVSKLKDVYAISKQLYNEKKYNECLDTINKFFSSSPDKSTKLYEDMIILLVDVNEALEIEPKKNITKKDSSESKDVSFMIIDDVPVFPGCKGSKAELKSCFSKMIQLHFAKKFNADLPNNLGLYL